MARMWKVQFIASPLLIIFLALTLLTGSYLLGPKFLGSITNPSAPIIFDPYATSISAFPGITTPKTSVGDTAVISQQPVASSNIVTGCCSWSLQYLASMPNYAVTAGISGPALLNSSSLEGRQMLVAGNNPSPTSLPVAPYTPSASQILSPGSYCVPGTSIGAICNPYMIVQNFTSTIAITCQVTSPPPCGSGITTINKITSTEAVWYVGRQLMQLSLSSPGNVQLVCQNATYSVLGITGSTCDPNTYCNSLYGFSGCSQTLTAALQGSDVQTLNQASKITGSYAVQINIPGSWANTNLDWYVIYDAWLGLNANTQTLGSCTSSTCNTGLGDHAVLGVYSDPAATVGAFTPFSKFYTNLANLNAVQIAALISGNAISTVYTKIPVQSFGTTVQVATASCTIYNLNGCFTVSTSSGGSGGTSGAFMAIPIIFDTIGTKSTFQTSYQAVNPTATGNTITGTVLDGGSTLCQITKCPGLGGATITSGNQMTATASDGSWTLSNLIPGSNQIAITKAGYQQALQTVNCPQAGTCTPSGTVIVLNPVASAGTFCLIPPISNPVPGQGPLFAGICIPVWMIVGLFILGVVGLLATIAFSPLGQGLGFLLAARGTRGRRG